MTEISDYKNQLPTGYADKACVCSPNAAEE